MENKESRTNDNKHEKESLADIAERIYREIQYKKLLELKKKILIKKMKEIEKDFK